eukprot:GEMP01034803.1.p1 GENE.GEMP01034803.1~~GEMP01034803.1.p1  ORF type:complete len:280 (+),score=53.09 GEMP01034803.1:579-1418(+)
MQRIYRDEIIPKLTHWEHRKGVDHLFIFSDQGMNWVLDWRTIMPTSAFLVTEALTPGCGPSCFNPWKDVVLPGHTDLFRGRKMRKWNKPSVERLLLFNFHGRHPGINKLYEDNIVRGKIIELFDGLEGVSVGGFTDDYFERMGASHYCLVPRGTSSWTNHLYEAFFAGCIPVIISDDFEVPFQEFLDWKKFSIKWPEADVENLYRYLRLVPFQLVEKMKEQVDLHACWFDYHQWKEPCSPYSGLLRILETRHSALPKAHRGFWGNIVPRPTNMSSSFGV